MSPPEVSLGSMAGARLGLIGALLAVGGIGCGWTAQRRVASNAQIVFMAPVKASSLGKCGYEVVTTNLDGSNRRQITDNDQQEFPRPAISAGDTRK